jgi:hypothetical protein
MEITLEAIISFIGLFVGGGAGAFFTWRYQRKKAKAEAENAEIDAAKELQGMYQTMLQDANTYLKDAHDKVEGLRQERDHYKQERDETRENLDKLTRNVMEWKRNTDDTIDDLRRQVARNGRQIEAIRPFMCGDLQCKNRQRVTISEEGVVKAARKARKAAAEQEKSDIEPIEQEAL